MVQKNHNQPKATEEEFSRGLPVTNEFLKEWRRTAERREIGRKLEEMRRNADLTQHRLAELMGKDQAFVARMESGRGNMPKSENIALFADACGFATAYAFVEIAQDDGLTLHELQPIGQSPEVATEMEAVHDVALPTRATVASEG